MNGGACGLIR